jgi:hypothetical protein
VVHVLRVIAVGQGRLSNPRLLVESVLLAAQLPGPLVEESRRSQGIH